MFFFHITKGVLSKLIFDRRKFLNFKIFWQLLNYIHLLFQIKFANLNMIHDKGIEETKIATNFREKRKRIERSEVKLKKTTHDGKALKISPMNGF